MIQKYLITRKLSETFTDIENRLEVAKNGGKAINLWRKLEFCLWVFTFQREVNLECAASYLHSSEMQITREQRFTSTLAERATCNLYKLPDFISGVLALLNRPYLHRCDHGSGFHLWSTGCGKLTSVQFSGSVMSDSLRPMDCSAPGFPVYHRPLELAQTHVHWVSDPSNYLILCQPFQFWKFIGRTDAEAETPIHLPPDLKNWLFGKDRDAGKDWGQEEKGMKEETGIVIGVSYSNFDPCPRNLVLTFSIKSNWYTY